MLLVKCKMYFSFCFFLSFFIIIIFFLQCYLFYLLLQSSKVLAIVFVLGLDTYHRYVDQRNNYRNIDDWLHLERKF